MEDDGRCPNCGEDELEFGTDCHYCGWPEHHERDCDTCCGTGRETYYVGTYGTSSCNGPAERECRDCDGTGRG